jgi:NADH-quinone oxidoreductase subunit N
MEAGVKYFVVSVVSSAIMLFGLALLVSVAGTTSISAMAAGDLFGAGGSSLVLLGMAMTIAGFAFKLGITPSNFWIPDVYQGSPPQVAGFLAGATKKAAYAAFLRLAVVFVAFHAWSLLFAVLAAITMSVPNVIALLQTDVRRTLAYSIMSQAGFLLLGFAAMTQMAGNTLAIGALLFHILTHAVMVMGAFLVLAVYDAHRIESLDQFKGQGYRNPFLGIALTLFLLSLAGIPLLAGFVSKFFLIYAVADAGLLWLGALAIINSVIALYYYFRIIRALWGYPGGGTPYRISRGTFVGIALCLVLTVLIGVWPEKFVDLAMRAAASLG